MIWASKKSVVPGLLEYIVRQIWDLINSMTCSYKFVSRSANETMDLLAKQVVDSNHM